MVNVEADESFNRAIFGRMISEDAAKLKDLIGTIIKEIALLPKEDYIGSIGIIRGEVSNMVGSFDRETKRAQLGPMTRKTV